MKPEIKKILIDDEIVHISKKDSKIFPKWHIVYPIKNEDGTINWRNLIAGGSWWNLIFVIFFVIIFIGAAYEYHLNFESCTVAMEKLNAIENASNILGLNPITDNLRFQSNITLEVNTTG